MPRIALLLAEVCAALPTRNFWTRDYATSSFTKTPQANYTE